MAYGNVGTPRLYIDLGQYYNAIGIYTPVVGVNFGGISPQTLSSLNPTSIQTYTSWGSTFATRNDIIPATYIAFLGHDIATEGGRCYAEYVGADDEGNLFNANLYSCPETEVVNLTHNVNQEYDGFSIGSFPADATHPYIRGVMNVDTSIGGNHNGGKIGAISIGRYYDMPHSPDLNLKLTYEYDGVKNITTKGGSILSNASYTKPADWGDGGAWQLSSTLADGSQSAIPSNLRSGRRVWDLSFSYISDTDMFPVNASQSHAAYTNVGYHSALSGSTNPTSGFLDIDIDSEDGGTAGQFQSNILSGQDFFSVVWNRTMGGHLPFIFNPSGGGTSPNNNPDQFAICRFVGNSLQYDQVANNVYNVKLKIRESW